MRRTYRRFTRRHLLIALLACSALAVLLPRGVTGRLINMVQVLLPFQHGVTWTVDTVAGSGEPAPVLLTPQQAAELQRSQEALRHQLAALSVRLQDLQRDYSAALGVRARGLRAGELLEARVVGGDAAAWRDSRLVNAGTLAGVRSGAAVASHYFTIGLPENGSLQADCAVLDGEVLIGFVDAVGTHAARVRLLTDLTTRMPVVVARLEGDKLLPLQADFWMEGTGADTLAVRDVDHRFIRNESIKPGDLVLSAPADARLPAALTIGTITRIDTHPENRLLYTLQVAPAVDFKSIRKVFVVSFPEGVVE